MKSEEGSGGVEGFGGKTIKDIGGSREGVSPIGGGHGRLEV